MSSQPRNLPLRWESIGDQWWYVSPIDFAAANGLYDLVRELLYLDTNLLIKLTSLRRVRRLETVWDDDHEGRPSPAAKNRARIARSLLVACESRNGENSLIRAGYGGWLLYTAAAGGDAGFVAELLGRDPLLVFGEGEYGLSDLMYAAARGGSPEVFRRVVECALSPRGGEELRWEVANRAAHGAARGGSWEVLREIVEEESGNGGVLRFRDEQGCSLLHSAAGNGQVEVVKHLIESYDIITSSTDNQGNTALHVAANRGHLAVVKALALASPSLTALKNVEGDTFLHMAVSGFRAPGFRRLDKLLELVSAVVSGSVVNVADVVNARNDDGRTALHAAVVDNIHIGLVELLLTAPTINLNVRDFDGMTPLDLLKRRPRSASSELLIKRLICAGGISNSRDHRTRKALVSQLKNRGVGASPGTSFWIPDAEIFLYTGMESTSEANGDNSIVQFNTFSGNLSNIEPRKKKKPTSFDFDNNNAKHLNFFLRWSKRRDKNPKLGGDSLEFHTRRRTGSDGSLVPLRQIFSKAGERRRSSAEEASFPSPTTRMKFAVGLTHGVIKTLPTYLAADSPLRDSAVTVSSGVSSPAFEDREMIERLNAMRKACGTSKEEAGLRGRESMDEKMVMNEYFSYGAHQQQQQQGGVVDLDHQVEDSLSCTGKNKHHLSFRNNNSTSLAV